MMKYKQKLVEESSFFTWALKSWLRMVLGMDEGCEVWKVARGLHPC